MPTGADVFDEIDTIDKDVKSRFLPSDSAVLAKMWVDLVAISSALGKVLRTHYQVSGSKATVEDIDSSARELDSCRPKNLLRDDIWDISLVKLHAYHVELFYE